MSFNLLTAAKSLITNELVSKASSFLGESESGVSKAIGGILPSLVLGLADKAGNNGGANTVCNLALQAHTHNTGFLNNLSSFFSNDNSGNLLNKGAAMLSGLFSENKIQSLTSLISNYSGIKSSSATSLLSMATPMVLGLLGKQITANHLTGSDIASFMADQKNTLKTALPSGLNLSSVFSDVEKMNTVPRAKYVANETSEKTGAGLKWFLPLLLLTLAALAAYYLMGKGCNSTPTATEGSDSSKSTIGEIVTNVKNIPGKLDSLTQDWIYDAGKDVTIDLPNNGGKLTIGETSTENRLYQFLMDSNAKVDTAKGNWFEFTNVRFKTGGSQLDSTSMLQLKNMATIIKAFPTAEFKLGGYTDNTGDSTANVVLSQKRAETVVDQLKKLGTVPSSITGAKGYGPQWPLADNATPEGRAQNRRVAINVKAK